MSDTFCPLPWIGYSIRGDGHVRACCRATQGITGAILSKEDGTPFKYDDSIDESRNSKALKSIRLSIINRKWHSTCVRCMEECNSGLMGKNYRDSVLWKEHFTEEDARESTRSDGSIDTSKIPLRHFDLRLGNICNLKCAMCGPVDSSGWYKDYEFVYGKKYRKLHDWYKNDGFWEELSKYKDSIKRVYIAGGEPLITYEHYDFLDKCIKGGYSKKMTIDYNTNLTVIPEKAIRIWENFDSVVFGVSVDGVGKVNDYIRWPSKFSVLEKNLKLLDEAEANYRLWICYTVSVFNMLHLPEFVIWKIRQNFKRVSASQHSPFLSAHPLHKPDHMSIKIFPRKSISIIENYLRESVQRVADELTKNNAPNLELSMKIYSRMIEGYIKFMYQEDCSKLIPEFWSVSDKIDEIRGCKLKDYIPEIIELLPRG